MQSRQTSLKLYNVPRAGFHLAPANRIMHYQKIGTLDEMEDPLIEAITFPDGYLSDMYLDQVGCYSSNSTLTDH